jgi:hypothetical protein
MSLTKEQQKKITSRVISKAWTDPSYKEKLIADPKGTLEAEGIQVNSNFVVVSNTKDKRYFVIPAMPDLRNISDKDIENKAAMMLDDQIEMF